MTDKEKVNIQALAGLARLEVREEEVKTLEEQIPAILSFVARIQEVAETAAPDKNPAHKNVMRDDTNPHETGVFTDVLLSAAPRREGDYVKVPQVIKGGKHI